MKTLNFGSCNIDYVYSLAHIVVPGETISSDELNKFPGGKGLNQSIALARSGVDVYHAGCIGQDGFFLKEILEKSGVNTKYLKIEDAATGNAIIQVDKNGENSIILYHGTNHMIDERYIDSVLENFSSGDILIIQNEISNLDYIISKGYEKKMKIVLNPSPFDKSFADMDLNKISLLILNEIEAYGFTGQKDTDAIVRYFKEKFKSLEVVLTLGSGGAVYSGGEIVEYCPSYCVDAVDTTAAGDTFTGYFLSGMIQGLEIKQTLKYASAAAALSVMKMGAAASIPKKEEVEKALEILTPREFSKT